MPDKLVALDHWAVVITKNLQQKVIAAYDAFQFQTIYQLIHNFCSVELGSFYLDIIKDRLYTAKADGAARRSAQTAMYHILEALVRWLAPIISFTADEIWMAMPGTRFSGALFYDQWYSGFNEYQARHELNWSLLMAVRDEVNKVLETRRQSGDIGSALDAEVTLYAESELLQQLKSLEDELRFMLITSAATVKPLADADPTAVMTALDQLQVVVTATTSEKCARCWQRTADVGSIAEHETICERCVSNITGTGESRRFA